jgi:hypothetical protein
MNFKCLEISKQNTNGFFFFFLFKYSKFDFVEEQKLNFGFFFIAAPKFYYFVSILNEEESK